MIKQLYHSTFYILQSTSTEEPKIPNSLISLKIYFRSMWHLQRWYWCSMSVALLMAWWSSSVASSTSVVIVATSVVIASSIIVAISLQPLDPKCIQILFALIISTWTITGSRGALTGGTRNGIKKRIHCISLGVCGFVVGIIHKIIFFFLQT